MKKKPKFIFVVGGVMSSVGKGITTSSLGVLLQSKGFLVTCIKADPYINLDAGTMNPTEHGEVFVTEDKDECDQDVGNYERFLNQNIFSYNYMTTGRIYQTVINRERNLEYKGKCVEVVPHIPEEVIHRIKNAQVKNKADITLIEIGGTVGEYQNILFLEAARMLKQKNPDDVAIILVSYLPIPQRVGEMKTKPTQSASRELNSVGLQANFIIGRSELALDSKRKEKLALFCSVDTDHVISAPDAKSIYDIPLYFEKEKLGDKILKDLHLPNRRSNLLKWKKLMTNIKSSKNELKIAVVGKYFGTGNFTLADSYVSVIEAIKHAAWAQHVKPQLTWIDSEVYEKDKKLVKELKQYHGVIVPGGWGKRGVEGIITAIKYCREQMIPYFGLCYGMQLACVEIARHLLKYQDANTVEINPKTKHPIINVNPWQQKNILEKKFGGTNRLGAYNCKLEKSTIAFAAYKNSMISERHRHRYEFDNHYLEDLKKVNVKFSGINPEQNLVEIIEYKKHPWFLGVQFHPEFKSRPLSPHPLFLSFIKACKKLKK